MSKELKTLFENAGIPQDVGTTALAIFEASVNEAADVKLAALSQELQESLETRFEEVKSKWVTEQSESISEMNNKSLADWSNYNVVSLYNKVKVEVA